MAQTRCTATVCASLLAVSRRRDVDHTLRLYSNPLKQSLYLLISLVFVAIGVLMIRDPKSSVVTVIMGYRDRPESPRLEAGEMSHLHWLLRPGCGGCRA